MTIKLGSHAVLLADLSEPDAGESLPTGARVYVTRLGSEFVQVATKAGTVGSVPVSALKPARGRPVKVAATSGE
jgi:hypothetical protein